MKSLTKPPLPPSPPPHRWRRRSCRSCTLTRLCTARARTDLTATLQSCKKRCDRVAAWTGSRVPHRCADHTSVQGLGRRECVADWRCLPTAMQVWDPILRWFSDKFDAPLHCVTSIAQTEHPMTSCENVRRAVSSLSAWELTAVNSAVGSTCSLVIAMALETKPKAQVVLTASLSLCAPRPPSPAGQTPAQG